MWQQVYSGTFTTQEAARLLAIRQRRLHSPFTATETQKLNFLKWLYKRPGFQP